MQMHILFYLSLIWILLSQDIAKANDDPRWKINVTQTIHATKGSNVIIPCTFEIPPEQNTNVKVYWKTDGKSRCSEKDNDKQAFAFHPDNSCIHPRFRRRTNLTGEASKGNCSLQILNIREGEPSIYLRVSGWSVSYSFKKYHVYIKVDGQNLSSLSHTDDPPVVFTTISAMPDVHDDGRKLYLAIFLPLLGLLIIAAAVVVAYKMHKRSHMMKRQESGYYANFKRTLSTPRKSEPLRKTSNTLVPDAKVIDEPVYMNLETSANQMDQQVGTIDNIYGNVDYTT
ncbi:uncharacterized protein LOC103478505 [Poecilia reticulata]|uniref:uncharacterized protein LOC103478505 n=1 Tax=Poecilia reticulata TaxID=8081 RepID=UPI0004A3BB94|nr:PREDICTED: uncharacterized protein LOC103478505 [Poecilia reticulata]XP_008430614.1 PREDICTED: uncharacterized protein LOC103478505 [Poecilia reticulata]